MDNNTYISKSARSVTFKFTTVHNERIVCSFDEDINIRIDSIVLIDPWGVECGSYTYKRDDNGYAMIPAYTMMDLLTNGWEFDQTDEIGRFTISVEDFYDGYLGDLTDDVREFLRDLIDD